MRGKVLVLWYRDFCPGITPAYAGKSCTWRHHRSGSGDHPRLCGEKYGFFSRKRLHRGSPPPMRGKVIKLGQCFTKGRITPAYAGKRLSFPFLRMFSRDHPRLCGEKQASASSARNRSGSPPPMRGKVRSCHEDGKSPRITPAYAGKRASGFSLNLYIQDHSTIRLRLKVLLLQCTGVDERQHKSVCQRRTQFLHQIQCQRRSSRSVPVHKTDIRIQSNAFQSRRAVMRQQRIGHGKCGVHPVKRRSAAFPFKTKNRDTRSRLSLKSLTR